MGGERNWRKMRAALERAPEVARIVEHLVQDPRWVRWFLGDAAETSPVTSPASQPPSPPASQIALARVTVASLLSLWDTANELTNDGFLRGAVLEDLDRMAGYVPGFGAALALPTVGWAVQRSDGVELPNYQKYNGNPLSSGAARTRRYRERLKAAREAAEVAGAAEAPESPSAGEAPGHALSAPRCDVTRGVTPSVTGDDREIDDTIGIATDIATKNSPGEDLKSDERCDDDAGLGAIFGGDPPGRQPPRRSATSGELSDRVLLITDIQGFTREKGASRLYKLYVDRAVDTLGLAGARDLVHRAVAIARAAEAEGERDGQRVRNRGAYWNRVFRSIAAEAGVDLNTARAA